MNNKLSSIKLNNGVEIPCIGIGPGIIGEVFKPTLHSNTFLAKVERKLTSRIKYQIARRSYIKSLAHALTLGYRLIDYSFAYGDGSEILEAIKMAGLKREDVFLTSRVSNNQQYNGTVREDFLRSLEKIGLDYIDMFMFHWPVTDHFVNTYKEMERLRFIRSSRRNLSWDSAMSMA